MAESDVERTVADESAADFDVRDVGNGAARRAAQRVESTVMVCADAMSGEKISPAASKRILRTAFDGGIIRADQARRMQPGFT